MISVQRTFTVQRDPESVAAYLADFSNAVEWDPGTVSCDRIDTALLAVGARWRNVSDFLGRRVELDYELLTWTADRVVLQGHNQSAISTDDIAIVRHPDGAQLTYRATIALTSVARLLSPLLTVAFQPVANRTVRQLRDALNRLAPG